MLKKPFLPFQLCPFTNTGRPAGAKPPPWRSVSTATPQNWRQSGGSRDARFFRLLLTALRSEREGQAAAIMLRKLTVDQISDWFTIGKELSDVKLLGDWPGAARPPGPAGENEETEGRRRSRGPQNEYLYVEEFKKLEVEEMQMYSHTGNETDHKRKDNMMPVPEEEPKYPPMPVLRRREELISYIENNSVMIIQGAPGSGKSTQLPPYILDYHMQQSQYCNIVVTQPRKIAACSIATWISKERKWTLGGLVGYQVGLERKATPDTRLIYVTTGVLLQKIVASKSLAEYTHIFIDEVHERTEEMDFLLMITRKLLRTNSRMVKIILMSATINCREFADYFAVPVFNRLVPACIFNIEGRPYDVEVFYLDDLKHVPRLTWEAAVQSFDEPNISKAMFDIAASLINEFDNIEREEERTKKGLDRAHMESNSVLVFLPGILEINAMHELFTNMVHKRLHVYPLHSSITLDEQYMVFMPPVMGYRKVILATNIAESSITVPDVRYVIDFCLTRTLVCDEETNYQSLRLSWASKMNCDQRKGRAGRVSKGYCYRLVLRDFWKNFIPENVVPEMLRRPLGRTILRLKLLDMGEPRALLATALSPPNVSDIERTILLLKEVGALAVSGQQEENPYDGRLTFLGRVLAQLPVDLHLGKLIVLGHVFGCLNECLIIAAALSLRNFFAMPFKQHLDGYRSKLSYAGNSRSDCIALVNAFMFWQECKERGLLSNPKNEIQWGKSNYFQIKRIREVATLYDELKTRIAKFNMFIADQPPVSEESKCIQNFILQVVMAGAFYPSYFTFGQPDQEMAVRDLGGCDPKTTVVLKNVPSYGFLYHKQIQSLFRQCGQVKSILFDASSAFVEFSRNPTESSRTLTAVHLALKMNQLKVPLALNSHLAETIEANLQQDISSLKLTRAIVDFQKQSVETAPQTIEELSEIIKGLTLTIRVTEVIEVGHFWGYRIDQTNSNVLGILAAEISHQDLTPLSTGPHPDLVCLAPYKDIDGSGYYRARILYICRSEALVFFVDYGNQAKVDLGLLREIPSQLLDLPFQALEFKICNMRPSARSMISGERWSQAAIKRFCTLVEDCSLMVKVFSVVHRVLHVDVYRCFERLEKISIRDLLIAGGYAETAEESFESKQSNETLKNLFTANGEMIHLSGFPKKKEKELMDVMLESFQNNQFGIPNSKVFLHGPFHPYEICFYSMMRVSKFRSVWIEKESINSVIVNEAPEETHQRMLFSAGLSINAAGSMLLLRETTLLPSIPGLPALLCMLFAPVIELRVNENRTEYTGVLCGLGWQYIDLPVFPEHDIEMAFDVQCTADDLMKINIIRAKINKMVCCHDNGSLSQWQLRTMRLQEEVRELLLNLFQKDQPREVIQPKWYQDDYHWNRVDSRHLISQSRTTEGEEKNAYIYQLHKIVMLNI